jgi:hypothetical protein
MNKHELHKYVGRIAFAWDLQGIYLADALQICILRITTMKRLDQGHLHPKLEVPRRIYLSREARTLEEPFEQFVNIYSEHLYEPATVQGTNITPI